MEVKVIDEKAGNPFKYYADDCTTYNEMCKKYGKSEDMPKFFRVYKVQTKVNTAMRGILKQIGLPRNIDCLEVGAGHNPKPSQALSHLGAKVITLDADWDPTRHTDISRDQYREMIKNKAEKLELPRAGGQNGDVVCYMGDIAFLRDPMSPLREKEFELIYFWGSIDGNGICSSVGISETPRQRGINIKPPVRLARPIPAVKEGGAILSVAGYFSGHNVENIKDIAFQNMRLADLGVYWALGCGRNAKVLGFFTQSPESVAERQGKELAGTAKLALCMNPLEMLVKANYDSRFGNRDDYARLKKAQDKLGEQARDRFQNLGLIDAVFVGY